MSNGYIQMSGTITHKDGLISGITVSMPPKEYYEEEYDARSVTINYCDGSSYTIKTSGYVSVREVKDKSERKISVTYNRKPIVVKSTDDFTVEEVGSVKEKVTLRQKDVKSIDVRESARTVSLTSFDQV